MPNLKIREATVDDAKLILHFIVELAIYEKAEHEVLASVADIQKTVFGENSIAHALICELDDAPIGFAVYFYNYSTWLGKNGLYLEDLYVTPEHRGVGAGKALLQHMAKIAVQEDCGRFEWRVLDWNEPSIKFYQSIGALPQDEWIGYRLDGQALLNFSNT